MKRPILAFGALLLTPLAGLLPARATAPLPAFQAGDRWCVLGDSITEGGYYHRYVELFYCTRFPERKLDVLNCGIRGDTAPGALRRLQWDCLAARPTVVSVMLGMNDVGWNLIRLPAAEVERRRAERAETYDQAMRTLTKSLLEAGVTVVLITPSIFDDTADLPREKCSGAGAALAGLANRVQAIAREFRTPVVDFNGPMTAINAEQQRRDPHFTIVGPDRVHPTEPGHFVMAYEFLRTQKLSGVVARITVDAAAGKPGGLENCAVTDLKVQPNAVSFTCLENSLPFPVDGKPAPALELVPFTQEFNQELLQVHGLAPGDYELSIGGRVIRTFSAALLADGVNLAVEPNAPQLRQSLAVLAELRRKWQVENRLRAVAAIEHQVWPDARPPADVAQRTAELDARLPSIAGTNREWAARLRANYLENKKREAELCRSMDAAVNAARLAAQPKPHAFTLRRVADGADAGSESPTAAGTRR